MLSRLAERAHFIFRTNTLRLRTRNKKKQFQKKNFVVPFFIVSANIMKTMSSVCFIVLVLIGVQKVVSNVCKEKQSHLTCDECIRCGGKWCSQPENAGCVLSQEDSWCPNHAEKLHSISPVSKNGDLISPIYSERSVLVKGTSNIKLSYTSKTPLKVTFKIVNTTQNDAIDIYEDYGVVKCSEMNCTTYIQATPSNSFCSSSGTSEEFVTAHVSIGDLGQPAVIKYHIACACECSQSKSSRSSQDCSGHGHYSCGRCNCDAGWKGNECDEEDCPWRGDITTSCKSPINDLDCSGNGRCNCSMCECDMSLEGSQYFDPELCTDLCMDVNVCTDCTDCIYNSTVSECDIVVTNKPNNMIVLNKNVSLIDEWDDRWNKKKWVRCNVTVRDCDFSYVAKRGEDDEIYVMVIESCNDAIVGAITPAPTVSIVLGVLGLLAAVMAVAGVLIWKQMNSLPPVPLNGAGYTDIDAEDCVGENPLYKPPTSSFKNPTYGQKW